MFEEDLSRFYEQMEKSGATAWTGRFERKVQDGAEHVLFFAMYSWELRGDVQTREQHQSQSKRKLDD